MTGAALTTIEVDSEELATWSYHQLVDLANRTAIGFYGLDQAQLLARLQQEGA